MSWNDEKVAKLKELWGKGNTASQIAEIIGGISRNAVIGKAHRLNLSAKIKTRATTTNNNFTSNHNESKIKSRRSKRSKWPIGHPDEKSFYFCGRTSLKDFSYCKLHLLYAYQPKGKKDENEENSDKEEVQQYINKKEKAG